MKLKEGFILRKIADNYVVIAVGKAADSFNGMIQLNQTGAFLFEQLSRGQTEKELAEALVKEYNVDKGVAESDVKEFLQGLEEANLLK